MAYFSRTRKERCNLGAEPDGPCGLAVWFRFLRDFRDSPDCLSALSGLGGLVYGLTSAVIREWTFFLVCICLRHPVQACLIVSTGICTFPQLSAGKELYLASLLCFPGFKWKVHVQKAVPGPGPCVHGWVAAEQFTVETPCALQQCTQTFKL